MTMQTYSGKCLCALIALIAALLLACSPASAKILKVLVVSDIYEFDAPGKGKGGMARLVSAIEREREAMDYDVLLTVHAGDALSPSLYSQLDKGKTMIEALNTVGIDMFLPGNHEFDMTYQILTERIAESRFPWLVSNVLYQGNPIPGTVGESVIEKGGFRIGFVGATTAEVKPIDPSFQPLAIADPVSSLRAAVAGIRAKNPDIILALTHLDYDEDIRVIKAIPAIYAVIGGHDHFPYLWADGGRPVIKAGSDGEWLGVLIVYFAGKTPKNWEYRLVSVDDRFAPSPWLLDLTRERESQLAPILNQVIGTSSVLLEGARAVVRTRESNIGSLVADAMRQATGAQIALQHGGGLRWEDNKPPGPLTVRDIHRLLPFGNTVAVVSLSGATLHEVLEAGVSTTGIDVGALMHPSGIRYAFDPKAPDGSRLCRIEISEDGKWVPLAAEKQYAVAIPDYLHRGGMGLTMFREKGRTVISPEAGSPEAAMVIRWIEAQKEIAPAFEGRITEEVCVKKPIQGQPR